MTPDERSFAEFINSVHQRLSGIGGVIYELRPLHSRLASQTIDGPCSWLIPVITTEASPRLVSITNSAGNTQHVIVWDERYTHYLARILTVHEALMHAVPSFESSVRAVAVIAWDFVLEQLCPENRISRMAVDPTRVRQVLGHTFAQCTQTRNEDQQLLDSLINSAEMNNPRVQRLLNITISIARDLAVDHEAHHYLRRHASEWDKNSPVPLAEMETQVLNLISPYERFMTTGALPEGRIWSFFETVLSEFPFTYLREEFEGTQRGEEIQCDLVPLMQLCDEGKENVRSGCDEMQEFKGLAFCYSAGRAWQIASIFLTGLRIEVARALGRNIRLTSFEESDLGLRLMLGNWMCYKVLTDPPYAPPGDGIMDQHIVELVESTRPVAQAMTKIWNEESSEYHRRHRALFLDNYERSNHYWLWILNAVGLEIADKLSNFAAANAPTPPPVPDSEDYLEFLGIYSAERMAQRIRRTNESGTSQEYR